MFFKKRNELGQVGNWVKSPYRCQLMVPFFIISSESKGSAQVIYEGQWSQEENNIWGFLRRPLHYDYSNRTDCIGWWRLAVQDHKELKVQIRGVSVGIRSGKVKSSPGVASNSWANKDSADQQAEIEISWPNQPGKWTLTCVSNTEMRFIRTNFLEWCGISSSGTLHYFPTWTTWLSTMLGRIHWNKLIQDCQKMGVQDSIAALKKLSNSSSQPNQRFFTQKRIE